MKKRILAFAATAMFLPLLTMAPASAMRLRDKPGEPSTTKLTKYNCAHAAAPGTDVSAARPRVEFKAVAPKGTPYIVACGSPMKFRVSLYASFPEKIAFLCFKDGYASRYFVGSTVHKYAEAQENCDNDSDNPAVFRCARTYKSTGETVRFKVVAPSAKLPKEVCGQQLSMANAKANSGEERIIFACYPQGVFSNYASAVIHSDYGRGEECTPIRKR